MDYFFRRAGEAPPLSKDNPFDPDWVATDVLRQGEGVVHTFWFEHSKGNADAVIAKLVAAGADDARTDGSSQIVRVTSKPDKVRDLAAICLAEGGLYLTRLPRVP